MKFPEVSPSRAECQRQIVDALRSEGARLYVDASVLIHCYEMSRSACEELLAALTSLEKRVRVPVWSAQETWDVTRELPNKRPLKQKAAALKKRLQDFRAESLRYIDEQTFGDITLEEYTTAINEAVTKLEDLARRVEGIEPGHEDANAQLLPFIAERSVPSNMLEIFSEVQRTGELRFTHEVPPGFADGGTKAPTLQEDGSEEQNSQPKGKKKNRYGDLIMWLEALQDCAREKAQHLIVLTRDNSKRDWVYRPERIKDDEGKLLQNGGLVTLPLPLLTQEAMQRCAVLEGVHVLSLEMFTQVMRTSFGARVGSLGRALQSANRPRPTSRSERAAEQLPLAIDGVAQDISFSSQDMIYEPTADEMATSIGRQILGLHTEGWEAQNEAANILLDLVPSATPSELKQIGRGIIVASNEDAIGPIELAQQVLENTELSATTRANLLVGMLAETYFDENGEPKKPEAYPEIISMLFAHANDVATRPAYQCAVEDRLGLIRKFYLGLPGEAPHEIRLELLLNGRVLRGVQADGVELLESEAPHSRRIGLGSRTEEISVSDLVEVIAREFVVRVDMLRVDGPTNFLIEVPPRLGFIAWGPATGERLR
ncbi:PIN-like domain-containing protein [Lacibacterium aquatile]|uniref:PIN-like domain-containing protein n=1 Tax=Lacibacterium aquatile TaxID=1168082 RepID=A0ABW5DTH2_9PROT